MTLLLVLGLMCCGGSAESSEPPVPPLKAITFDAYSSTDALLRDCTTWRCGEDSRDDENRRRVLDSEVAYRGFEKSMRFDYRHPGNGCNTQVITREIPLDPPLPEVWAEVAIRWASNFRTTNDSCAPNDHKLVFGATEQPNTYRWQLKVGSDVGPDHSVVVRAAGTNAGENDERRVRGLKASDLWDGDWHIIRLHFRHSTGGGGRDGEMRLWVDGKLRYEETEIQTATDRGVQDRIRGIALGRNKDDGPANEWMSLWWGYVKIWDENPRWR